MNLIWWFNKEIVEVYQGVSLDGEKSVDSFYPVIEEKNISALSAYDHTSH